MYMDEGFEASEGEGGGVVGSVMRIGVYRRIQEPAVKPRLGD